VEVATLEARRLLTTAVDDFQLVVQGTVAADVIVVRYNTVTLKTDVTVNGVAEASLDPALFFGIRVDALGGDDSVTIDTGRPAVVDGGAGDDTIQGGSGADILGGGAGSDVLRGGGGGDLLSGDTDVLPGDGVSDTTPVGVGDDSLFGEAGSDQLLSGGGSDLLDGGSQAGGGDVASFNLRTDDLTLSLDGVANDGASGETGDLVNVEGAIGGAGDDLITGNGKGNELDGGRGGADTLYGLGGDDVLRAAREPADDSAGNLLDGGSGDDQLTGGDGPDSLLGQSGGDTVDGHGGRDTIRGGSGADVLAGDTQFVRPDGGGESIFGDAGGDRIYDTDGDDTIDAGSGDDAIFLGDGDDQVFGRAGDDVVNFAAEDHTFTRRWSGGGGVDTLDLTSLQFGVLVRPTGNADSAIAGNALSTIDADFEVFRLPRFSGEDGSILDASNLSRGVTVSGSFGPDTITGSSAADLIEGLDGDDSLVGGPGEDVLRGGNGADTLVGGAGADSFNGGFGNDLLEAQDGEADVVNGAQGLGDRARRDDPLDTLIRVETIL
jgi:Ca2+-binding RTX toxin-like protein